MLDRTHGVDDAFFAQWPHNKALNRVVSNWRTSKTPSPRVKASVRRFETPTALSDGRGWQKGNVHAQLKGTSKELMYYD